MDRRGSERHPLPKRQLPAPFDERMHFPSPDSPERRNRRRTSPTRPDNGMSKMQARILRGAAAPLGRPLDRASPRFLRRRRGLDPSRRRTAGADGRRRHGRPREEEESHLHTQRAPRPRLRRASQSALPPNAPLLGRPLQGLAPRIGPTESSHRRSSRSVARTPRPRRSTAAAIQSLGARPLPCSSTARPPTTRPPPTRTRSTPATG